MTTPVLTYAEHGRAILKLGLPLIASNVAQFAIHMTDALMLGWYDVTALAAVTIGSTMFFIVFIVGAGFGFAVTPLVAAAVEGGEVRIARRVVRMAVWLSIIFGAIVTPPFMMSETILRAMGQPADVAALAQDYLRIAIWGMIPALIAVSQKSFLAALEHAGVLFWATVGAAILNAGLNWVLIFGNFGAPELGIRGAAIASVVLQSFLVLVLTLYHQRRLPEFQLLRNPFRPDPEIMARVFKIGLPIGLTSLAEGGLFSASAVMMGWLGEVPLAAHGIALQLAGLTFMVHIGLSQAATVRAGRALGRRDQIGLVRGGQTAVALSGVFALLTVAIFLAIPELLVGAFVDPASPDRAAVLGLGVSLLALAALFQLVDAGQAMALGLLRGVQDTTVPMLIAVATYWGVGLPAGYALAFVMGLGPQGLWLGLVVGLSAAAVALSWRFWMRSVRIAPPEPIAAG